MDKENKTLWQRLTDWEKSPICRYFKKREAGRWVKALKDADSDVRWGAVEALVQIGLPAIPALIVALKDEESLVRFGAVNVLDRIEEASLNVEIIKTVPALIGALKDTDLEVRRRAVFVLAEIAGGYPGNAEVAKVVPKLIEALKDKDRVMRERVCNALGWIGEPSAVPALIYSLKDENDFVQGKASKALENIFQDCKTREKLESFEKGLQEGYALLRKESIGGKIGKSETELSKLMKLTAMKKNELAPDKSILLSGIPKPPKPGKGVYRTARKIFV